MSPATFVAKRLIKNLILVVQKLPLQSMGREKKNKKEKRKKKKIIRKKSMSERKF